MSARTVGPVTRASSTGAAASLVIVYAAGLAGVHVPELVAGALVVLATAVAGYLVKPGPGSRRG